MKWTPPNWSAKVDLVGYWIAVALVLIAAGISKLLGT